MLFIGDTRQHQGVEAGKPFEQLVQAGMKTAQLDQIVRQKDPELLRAVEHLSRGEVAEGIALLEQQGRVTEIADPQKRIAAIARNYAAQPGQHPRRLARQRLAPGRSIRPCVRSCRLSASSQTRRAYIARAHAALRYDRSRPHLGGSL